MSNLGAGGGFLDFLATRGFLYKYGNGMFKCLATNSGISSFLGSSLQDFKPCRIFMTLKRCGTFLRWSRAASPMTRLKIERILKVLIVVVFPAPSKMSSIAISLGCQVWKTWVRWARVWDNRSKICPSLGGLK